MNTGIVQILLPVSTNCEYFLEAKNNSGACQVNLPDLGSLGEIIAR